MKIALIGGGGRLGKSLVKFLREFNNECSFQIVGRRNYERLDKEINQFNSVIMEVCENEGLKYIDITPISRQAKTNLSLVASDGLHPSEKMYSIWVKKIINQLNLD